MADEITTKSPPTTEKNGETTEAAPAVDQKGKGKRTATEAELEEASRKEKAKAKAVDEDEDDEDEDGDEEEGDEEEGEGDSDEEEEEEELTGLDLGNIRATRTRQRKPINYASDEVIANAGLTRKELDLDDD